MNYSNVILLISDVARAILVSYEDSSKPSIKKTIDPNVSVGDYVVVETDTRWNMTVCKVKEVDVEVDFEDEKHLGWIIAKVDLEQFDDIKAQENAAIAAIKEDENREKRERIQTQLRKAAGGKVRALPICTALDDKPTE